MIIIRLGGSRANLALSVLCVFSKNGLREPGKGPFYAKILKFCVKSRRQPALYTHKIGLTAPRKCHLELKRLIFLGNGSFFQLCGKKP